MGWSLCPLPSRGCELEQPHVPLQTPGRWVPRGHSIKPRFRRGGGGEVQSATAPKLRANWPRVAPQEDRETGPRTRAPHGPGAGGRVRGGGARRGRAGGAPPNPLRQALPGSVHSEDICAGRGPPPHVRAGSTRHLLDCSVRCRTTDVKAPRPCGERAARRKAYSVLGLRSSTTNAVAGSKVLPTWGRGRERRRETRRETETETVKDR